MPPSLSPISAMRWYICRYDAQASLFACQHHWGERMRILVVVAVLGIAGGYWMIGVRKLSEDRVAAFYEKQTEAMLSHDPDALCALGLPLHQPDQRSPDSRGPASCAVPAAPARRPRWPRPTSTPS